MENPASSTASLQSMPGQPISQSMLDMVLSPYHPDCRYLKQAWREIEGNGDISACARFSIGQSFYIDSTGHFNAVEANICVNQLAYLLLADFVARNESHAFWAALGEFDMDAFKDSQLARMFIVSMSTKFRKAMDGTSFIGRLRWRKATSKMGLFLSNMDFSFSAQDENSFYGNVVFAISRN